MKAPFTTETVVFHGNKAVLTSAEVYAVIRARHAKQLKVCSTFSDPTGTATGGPGTEGRMETAWVLPGADQPVVGARTTWKIGEKEYERIDETHEYFLFCATNGELL